MVGKYPALAGSGAGFFYDDVLEYRTWCHPEHGAPDKYSGDDYYCAFASYEDALGFSNATKGAEAPLVLVLQKEWIDEPEPGSYSHEKCERITEWQVEWLADSKRDENSISCFLSQA